MNNEKIIVNKKSNSNNKTKNLAREFPPQGGSLFIAPSPLLSENMYRGYIKVYRKIKDWIFFQKPLALALWVILLCEANHKTTRKMFNGKKIDLLPGQLLTGRQYLAQLVGISEGTVEKYLKEFVSEQQIIQQTSTKNRLITILNWGMYQGNCTTDCTTEKQQTVQQNDTPNNDNNDNNDKNDKNITDNFNSLWGTYPIKEGKKEAFKHYKASLGAGDRHIDIKQALENYINKVKVENIRTQYIKHGKTFFNNWKDYLNYKPIPKDLIYPGHQKLREADEKILREKGLPF